MADCDEASTTVRVAVRVRPLSQKEVQEGGADIAEIGKDGATVTLNPKEDGSSPSSFAFDHVFGTDSTQPQVFEALGMPLLDKAFEGYNSTIFAYGQTGSGKTHTMMSDRNSADRGLIPRISENLFDRITKLTSDARKFLVCCSFLEIYNEIVYDLLVPRGKNTPKTGLEIREGKGMGVYVKDLQEIVVDSSEKLQKLIDQGFEHRATASTQMNSSSSRSHCLFIIKMHQKDDVVTANNNFSKMNLVDLAGSERASKTGAQGDTLKEGANINKSLSALGNVINALSSMASGSKKVFIPYRNSKLTRVLQESLGGNALTTMMAAISPSATNCDETLGTLNYAKRAKTIKVNATKNEEAEQIAKLMEEVEALRAKLAEQASGVADTGRYETQIQDMERFMKQSWEDKERETVRHEEERKALEMEALKNIERANAERQRRLKQLEEKGDLELTVQELKNLSVGSETWSAKSSDWPSKISRLLALEQRVTAQCRAAMLCKDAVVHDVEHWLERRRQVDAGGAEEDGGAGARMLLQQAERKVSSMLRELESLCRQENELEAEVVLLLPQVRRVSAGVAMENSEEGKAKAKEGMEGKEGEEAKDAREELAQAAQAEEYCQVLSLVSRQLDAHRTKVWGQIAEDHKGLGSFAERLEALLTSCAALGADVAELSEQTRLELQLQGSKAPGAEAAAAWAKPLGLADEDLRSECISVSSNKEAASCARLLGGVDKAHAAYGGWTPARDSPEEYVQVDLGGPFWVVGVGVQGRKPISADWEQTRVLLAKVLDPTDPLPPERIFKRPPVRLIHDVFVAAHSKDNTLSAGKPDFSASQLDYKQLQNGDRQSKVDFFELLLSKTAHALKAAGWHDKVPPVSITPGDILGGKNTGESNRLLQILCYLCLRKRLGSEMGGLLDVADQWVTKFTLRWSADGTTWVAVAPSSGELPQPTEAAVFDASVPDADRTRYHSLRRCQPPEPVRFLRLHPQEWHEHPGLRLEVFGMSAEGKSAERQEPKSLTDYSCRLEVVRRRSELLQRCLSLASATTAERWHEAQQKEADGRKQALDEKSQVEQKLQDTMTQLEELRKAHSLLQDKAADCEQSLVDADTEKLRLEVDRDRAETQVKTFEEKLVDKEQAIDAEKMRGKDLEGKCEELKSGAEDLQQQIGVLTEERDCARAREEELFDTLNCKEEELMNTNDGYVYLTDQLNEVRDDLEEKVDQRDRMIETLTDRNKELLDESLKCRQDLGESRRKLSEAEKAVQRAEQGLPVSFKMPPATATTTASSPRVGVEAELQGYPPPGGSPRQAQGIPHSKSDLSKKDSLAGSDYEEDFDDE